MSTYFDFQLTMHDRVFACSTRIEDFNTIDAAIQYVRDMYPDKEVQVMNEGEGGAELYIDGEMVYYTIEMLEGWSPD
jgi:hypothetical protein